MIPPKTFVAHADVPVDRPFVPFPSVMPSPTQIPHLVRRAGASRLSGSAWMLVRGGAGGTLSGGRLGASQAGVRIAYELGRSRRVAVVARLATPTEGRGREGAVGAEWRPLDLPIRLIAEQRFSLDGGRGGPTLGVIGGYGPARVAPGLMLEGYAQAGGVARGSVEGFVDASARLTHGVPLGRTLRLDIGAGGWASAQRDAARIDIGPTIGLSVPVRGRAVRIALDWRERVAGAARPGSGPALSIGGDF